MLGALNSANILFGLATALIAYLLGEMTTAYLAVRLNKGQNIRCLGDRNVGAATIPKTWEALRAWRWEPLTLARAWQLFCSPIGC